MDTRMVVGRLRALGVGRNVEGIRKLLASPEVKWIAQAWIMLGLDDLEAVCRYAEKLPDRDPDGIEWQETELEHCLSLMLCEAGIETIGQAARRSDAELLALPDLDVFKLEELRAVQDKYLGKPKAAFMEPARAERVEKRIVEALAKGETPPEVAKRLRVSLEFVRSCARDALEPESLAATSEPKPTATQRGRR